MRGMRIFSVFGAVFGGIFALSGCDSTILGDHRLTSLRLSLISPSESELGTPAQAVQPSSLRFSVEALDEQGQIFSTSATVQAFLVAGGSRLLLKDPCRPGNAAGDDPNWLLSRFDLQNGRNPAVTLPLSAQAIFGRSTLNLEEPSSQAQGATPPIFFPNPTLPQVIKPQTPGASNASFCTPYLGRQVIFDRASTSAGALVVSSRFQNALAVSDSSAAEYGSVYVFTFGQPPAEMVKGRVLTRLSGAIAKFTGMTQIANPSLQATDKVQLELCPPPLELTEDRRPPQAPDAPENQFLFKYVAAPVRITGVVCEVEKDRNRSDNWIKYNTVTINQTDGDPESLPGCGGVNSSKYIVPYWFSVQFPGKGVGGFDPLQHAGTQVTITGMLQNSVSKSGKTLYFTVAVRDQSDVCLLPRAMCENAR